MSIDLPSNAAHAAGYDALVARYELQVIPHWHHSAISRSTTYHTEKDRRSVLDAYPRSFSPHDTLGAHLEFALKYDGVNLEILSALFAKVNPEELVEYIRSKPTGKYTRRIWYLYELLTGHRLPLEDMTMGNYVDLLEGDLYYTSAPVQIRRQRVNDNLLGDARFCPMVRRSELLQEFEKKDLRQKCEEVLSSYPRDILKRALSHLYTKETKSSFEIEKLAWTHLAQSDSWLCWC